MSMPDTQTNYLQEVISGQMSADEALSAAIVEADSYNGVVDAKFYEALVEKGLGAEGEELWKDYLAYQAERGVEMEPSAEGDLPTEDEQLDVDIPMEDESIIDESEATDEVLSNDAVTEPVEESVSGDDFEAPDTDIAVDATPNVPSETLVDEYVAPTVETEPAIEDSI